ncbi:tail fiber assembly protein [Enterobacter hormaechei]|uniref:tail fiber assembly protein n=1 Tax=Enterobacter hormaechei TaxID=158836 RepID=UPI000F8761C2|nr:tail fiber assembly protein [Enterobacter hormaechei]RTO96180.1 tail fiber assembly protein [Enterobacter hormaechei]
MKKYFSNSENSFYLQETIDSYLAEDIAIPEDLFEVTEDEYIIYAVSPDRKAPHYNTFRKCMEWVDLPTLSQEELIANAEALKAFKMSQADDAVKPLQDAVDTKMATNDESEKLLAWKRYRVLLNRIDTSSVPDIEWPDCPS